MQAVDHAVRMFSVVEIFKKYACGWDFADMKYVMIAENGEAYLDLADLYVNGEGDKIFRYDVDENFILNILNFDIALLHSFIDTNVHIPKKSTQSLLFMSETDMVPEKLKVVLNAYAGNELSLNLLGSPLNPFTIKSIEDDFKIYSDFINDPKWFETYSKIEREDGKNPFEVRLKLQMMMEDLLQ
jgi:hypothetical protein